MKNQAIGDSFILSVILNEMEHSISFSPDSSFSGSHIDIEAPLNYYLGNPDGTEVVGRSSVTSTDVADAIEWIMPSVMEAFLSNQDVVSFDPVNEHDEEQAELETLYVYDVLMKKNDGFVIMHEIVKDALMQKNGICKIYYVLEDNSTIKAYSGLTEEQFQLLVSSQSNKMEILELNENITEFGKFIDIRLKNNYTCAKIIVESVGLENILINSDHNSIDMASARFVCHTMVKTISELRLAGFDDKVLSELPTSNNFNSSFRQTAQNESIIYSRDSVDESTREISIQECYLYMDINNDGIAEYVKITTAGEDKPSHILSIEELPDGSPWVSCTGILMSHKFLGLSIFDRIKEIQDQSTAVLRSTLDNFYLQNNQEKEVVESLVVDMDEFLTSLPGGIKRVKKAGAVNPIHIQPFTDAPIQLMRYLAEMKAGRIGVSADGPSAPQNIGDRVGSQGVEALMTAKQALSGLIIRVLLETGLKKIFVKIRDLAHNHIDTIEDYKFKGRWVKVNPASWIPRVSTTVKAGLGNGLKQEKLAALSQINVLQEKIAASPFSYLLDDIRIYNTVNEFCKLSGLYSASKYMLDPAGETAMIQKQMQQQSMQQTQQKDDQIMMTQLKLQADLAQAELGKAQSMQDNVRLKAEVEAGKQHLDLMKHQYEAKMAILEQQYEQMKILADDANKNADIEFRHKQLDADVFKTLTKINADKDIAILKSKKENSKEELGEE